MAHGLRVWTNESPPRLRLDVGDRQVMHYASYAGTVGASPIVITVGGGYDITSGDWVVDVTPVNENLKVISTSNTLTISATAGSIQFRVNVFKLNQ